LEQSGSENDIDDVIRVVESVPKRQMDQSCRCYKCSIAFEAPSGPQPMSNYLQPFYLKLIKRG